jgi:ribosomal protein S18 acetylase RimI-like enzyme
MRIATCTEADLVLLERYLPTGHNNAHAYHFGRQQAGEVEYLIAWIDDVPVGQGVITWGGFLEEAVRSAIQDCPEIGYLGVEQHCRGKGVGSALVGVAEGCIAARGFGLAGLGVGTDNPRAKRLYERLGYRDTSMRCESRYTWYDDAGVGHDFTETNLYLVKDLSARVPSSSV